ncbi:calcium calmodulin-dependent kinase [Pyrenophora seminiperda CCB06]|uniref:Calcium calmodulin-dependent kinase n=1 Tax=Pyrenophora seminiperda CCB06 TaxID=1302712 RepID=A0A3M7LX21_9PLEO|nr:calcium calmodulin-dependent kinase [Pyrenophora seminiperda CCB06]
MTSTLQTQPAAAGILLVHPRLITPSPATAATFLHWTKLHFRDMLRLEGITCAMRFSAPEEDPRYSHAVDDEGSGKLPMYLYMCLLSELDVVRGAPYYAVSRKLKLDEEEEEEEGKDEEDKENEDESMVFDIVDAKFAVYEKLGGATTRTMGGKMKCAVICVSISPDSPSSSTTTDTDMSGIAKSLHDSLLDKWGVDGDGVVGG